MIQDLGKSSRDAIERARHEDEEHCERREAQESKEEKEFTKRARIKRCLKCQRKKSTEKVPMKRLLSLQRPEAWFIGLALFAAMVNGSVLPAFALIFSEVRFSLPEAVTSILPFRHFAFSTSDDRCVIQPLHFRH